MLSTQRSRSGDIVRVALGAILTALLAAPEGAAALVQDAQQPAAAGAAEESAKLPADQLQSLVAPIALYPDPLLAQCLVASTYPLDIVAAQQWLDKNKNLKGEELTKALEKEPWDPSVQSLVEMPDALKRMSENIAWTQDLGDAFLAQQSDVMDAVQALRKQAKDSGKLESSEQQKVETTTVESKTVIEIQPASTQVVYVPQYNPVAYWPAPPYPYPPVYYPPYYPGQALVSFGVGMAVGAAISGGWGYGCGWHGGGNTVNINNNNNFNRNSNRTNNVSNRSGNSQWQHNSAQRGGAPYKDKATANKYGGGARGDSAGARSAQAQSRQGQRAAGGDRGGASAGTRSAGGAGGGSRGGNSMGGRSVSQSSRGGSGSAFGGSQSGSRARSTSSRGASSMSSRGGGGRSGGGGGRRR
jgi:hypothetical protein